MMHGTINIKKNVEDNIKNVLKIHKYFILFAPSFPFRRPRTQTRRRISGMSLLQFPSLPPDKFWGRTSNQTKRVSFHTLSELLYINYSTISHYTYSATDNVLDRRSINSSSLDSSCLHRTESQATFTNYTLLPTYECMGYENLNITKEQ